MSRKSKLTLSKEQLKEISDCPSDIFNKIEPCDELFASVEKAESGDVDSLMSLAEHLYGVYAHEDELNPALLYFAKLGMSFGNEKCAEMMIRCMAQFNVGFEYLNDALEALSGIKKTETAERLIECAKLKNILFSADASADYGELTEALSEMYDEGSAFARIYLAHRRLKFTGSYDEKKINALAELLDIPSVIYLPSFTGAEKTDQNYSPANVARETDVLKFTIDLVDMDDWRDFWLRIIYEYCNNYLDGNLKIFSEEVNLALKSRCNYPRKNVHLLAFRKYLSGEVMDEDPESQMLEDECRFSGQIFDLSTPQSINETVKEAIYVCGSDERLKKRETDKLGSIILHEKNRFVLRATLKDHFKRVSKHMWNMTVSIETDMDTPPQINAATIKDRFNTVERRGISLKHEKKLSQVHCTSELKFREKLYPLELDLILDISYVSSTKCEKCELRVKDYTRNGKYITMYCTLSMY